jgi:hypothetical protein
LDGPRGFLDAAKTSGFKLSILEEVDITASSEGGICVMSAMVNRHFYRGVIAGTYELNLLAEMLLEEISDK